MRVGIVSVAAGTHDDGTASALAAALADQGHPVVLLVREPGPVTGSRAAPPESVRVLPLRAGPRRPITEAEAVTHVGRFTQALASFLERDPLDVLHSHGWLAGLSTQLAARAAGGVARTVALVHTVDQPSPAHDAEADARTRAERAVTANATHLIATSDQLGHTLVRTGIPRDRITVIPPGVSTDPGPRSRLGLLGRGAPHRVLVVGAAAAERAPETVAHALRRLKDVRVCAYRTPLEHPRPERADGAPAQPAAGVERNRLLGAADLVISGERLDTVHLEAMLLGIPVIALSSRVAEAVADGVTGVHAVDVPVDVLPRIVRDLLDNPPARQAMSIAAHDRVLRRYAWPRIAAETARVYVRANPAAAALDAAGPLEAPRPVSAPPAAVVPEPGEPPDPRSR